MQGFMTLASIVTEKDTQVFYSTGNSDKVSGT